MGRRRNVRTHQREAAQERVALERRWRDTTVTDHRLAGLVVARDAAAEPRHRWLSYRQGFSPELVRRFVADAGLAAAPILDPFNGSGTVTTECGRQGVPAIGVDAVGALAFLARARFLSDVPRPLAPASHDDLASLMRAAEHPGQRAAILCAAAAQLDGEGSRRKELHRSPTERAAEFLAMIAEDTTDVVSHPPAILHGDARDLPLGPECIGGVLTSPPYLSRYDYARINDPLERLLSGHGRRKGRRRQLRAAPTAVRSRLHPEHPAAEEAATELEARGDPRSAATVRAYFADLDRVLHHLARACAPGAPLWIVIAGADFKHAYVPSDLILAERAEALGLKVEALRVARETRSTGRRLGELHAVIPRETVVCLRRHRAL